MPPVKRQAPSSSARSPRPAGKPATGQRSAASPKAQPAKAGPAKASPAAARSPKDSKAAKTAPAKAQPAGTGPEVSAQQSVEQSAQEPARPLPVLVAAALTGLIGAVIAAYGTYLVIAGFTGQPVLRGRAELAGVIFLLFGLGVAWAARGLGRLQPWARTPSLLTQLMLLGVAYWMRQGGMDLWALVSLVVGLGGATLLFLPSSHRVLSRDVR